MTSKLERALAVHEAWLASGRQQPLDDLLAAHPELGELLTALAADRGELDRAIALTDGDRCELGDFRLLAELGRGGMGVVYRARQLSLDRDVALKVLPDHITRHPATVARFKREALLAANLEHPHIVAIHAVGQQGHTHYFAMELVDGGTLSPLDPATGRPRTVRATVELAAKVAAALAHAHAQGVLHRDVKPANILVRQNGEPVLTDFGLARQLADPGVTQSGTFAGTHWYASPEQLVDSRSVDARTDVWSLGATLYELLTGRRPFDGDSSVAIAERIRTSEPVDPLRLVPELASDLAAIVLKALEKQPARRYATAAAMRDDLLAFLEFRPVAARRIGPGTRALRWLQRHPGWRAATVAVAVALLVVPAVVTLAVTAERDRAVDAEARARRKAYGASLVAASTAAALGDRAQALQRLAACPVDLRGSEWQLVRQSLEQALWTASPGDRPITALAGSADAQWLATADELGCVTMLSAVDGSTRWRAAPTALQGRITALAFASDDTAVLLATDHGDLRRLAAGSGELQRATAGHGKPCSVTIHRSGSCLVRSRGSDQLEVFDADLQPVASHPLASGFDRPDAILVADGRNVIGTPQLGGLVAWDLATGTVANQSYGGQPAHMVADTALTRIVVFDATMGFTWWDRPADRVRSLHHGARVVTRIAASPDGRWLVAGGRHGELLVHDLDRARLLRALPGHTTAVTAVEVGTTGWFWSGASDGSVSGWNLGSDAGLGEIAGTRLTASLSGPSFGRGLACDDASGMLLCGGLDGTLRCFAPDGHTLVWQRQFPHWLNGLAVCGQNREVVVSWHDRLQRIAIADGARRGEELHVPGMSYVRRLAVAPDGVRCAVLDQAGGVAIVDLATSKVQGPVALAKISRSLTGSLAWRRDGTLWLGDESGSLHRLDPTRVGIVTTRPLGAAITAIVPHEEALFVATWDPDRPGGRLLRLDDHGEVASQPLPSQANAMAWLAGRLVLARDDGRLAIHDAADLDLLVEFPQPTTALLNVAASAAGDWLAMQCRDSDPRILHGGPTPSPAASRRRRAVQAMAAELATESLSPTGWPPNARRRIEARRDLPLELQQAAVAALPPNGSWRLRDIAVFSGFSATATPPMRAQQVELQACLQESQDTAAAGPVAFDEVTIALLELRLGSTDAAMARVQAIRDPLPPWWQLLVQFIRCKVFAARNDAVAAAAALEAMHTARRAEPGPDGSLDNLLREAAQDVARLR